MKSETVNLDKAYWQAMAGTEQPELIIFYCDECQLEFVFVKGWSNTPCEHLKAWLDKRSNAAV